MAKPRATHADAASLASSNWGLSSVSVAVADLPSYDDQNFKISTSTSAHVLKLAASGSECRGFAGAEPTYAMLCMENEAMFRVSAAGVASPCPVGASGAAASPTAAGSAHDVTATVVRADSANGGDGINYARLVTFLPGTVLAKVEHTPHLLRRIGASVAKTDKGLAGWTPPAADRYLTWDLAQAGKARELFGDLESADDLGLADKWLSKFEALGAEGGGGGGGGGASAGGAGGAGASAGAADAGASIGTASAGASVGTAGAGAADCRASAGAVGDASGADDNGAAAEEVVAGAATASLAAPASILASLPRQVIHGDLNDYNILIEPSGEWSAS